MRGSIQRSIMLVWIQALLGRFQTRNSPRSLLDLRSTGRGSGCRRSSGTYPKQDRRTCSAARSRPHHHRRREQQHTARPRRRRLARKRTSFHSSMGRCNNTMSRVRPRPDRLQTRNRGASDDARDDGARGLAIHHQAGRPGVRLRAALRVVRRRLGVLPERRLRLQQLPRGRQSCHRHGSRRRSWRHHGNRRRHLRGSRHLRRWHHHRLRRETCHRRHLRLYHPAHRRLTTQSPVRLPEALLRR